MGTCLWIRPPNPVTAFPHNATHTTRRSPGGGNAPHRGFFARSGITGVRSGGVRHGWEGKGQPDRIRPGRRSLLRKRKEQCVTTCKTEARRLFALLRADPAAAHLFLGRCSSVFQRARNTCRGSFLRKGQCIFVFFFPTEATIYCRFSIFLSCFPLWRVMAVYGCVAVFLLLFHPCGPAGSLAEADVMQVCSWFSGAQGGRHRDGACEKKTSGWRMSEAVTHERRRARSVSLCHRIPNIF